jgi:regulatory protein
MVFAKKQTKEADSFEKAYEYAIFLLSLRLRTSLEMQTKLVEKGFNESVVNKLVDDLIEKHYLDDQKFAEVFLDNLMKYKNFGFYGIKKKMMEKKVPMDLIESILNEYLTVEEELKIAKRFLKKEGFQIKKIPSDESVMAYSSYGEENGRERSRPFPTKQKMANKLKARGFRGDVIAKLVF